MAMRIVFILICLLTVTTNTAAMNGSGWKNVSSGLSDPDLKTAAADPEDRNILYAASRNALYRTTDGGDRWREVLSFKSAGDIIYSLAASLSGQKAVYAGTGQGLYVSLDRGENWDRIFNRIGEKEQKVLSVSSHPDDTGIIYAGTGSGLFLTRDGGRNWKKTRSLPEDTRVFMITVDHAHPHIIYAATDQGIFRSMDSGDEWIQILRSSKDREELFFSDEPLINEHDDAYEYRIPRIALDPGNAGTVYTTTSKGLLVSRNRGESWESMSILGLGNPAVRHIAADSSDPEHLYAATDRGLYRYSKTAAAWEELYRGMATSDIRWLVPAPPSDDSPPVLWAVTGRGIYMAASSGESPGETQRSSAGTSADVLDALSLFSHEPAVEEIRDAAMAYAEVQPGKIESWRQAAAHRAWLPDVRVSYTFGDDWQSSDYFYSTSSEKYRNDDITEGKDRGWSISLAWELGDLLWNSDQTSIDSRSRLTVQLRDDLLNEVTRLYFERRRIQIDMLLSPPADRRSSIEQDLRLQEITAYIDSLTGSFLSHRLAQAGSRAQRVRK